jgi:hypothetical protein
MSGTGNFPFYIFAELGNLTLVPTRYDSVGQCHIDVGRTRAELSGDTDATDVRSS